MTRPALFVVNRRQGGGERALQSRGDRHRHDEAGPISQLDEVTSRELRRDFTELGRSVGTTSVLVTHRLEEALEMAERVIVLGAPARVLAEVRTEAWERADPERLAVLRRHVADTLERGDVAPSPPLP